MRAVLFISIFALPVISLAKIPVIEINSESYYEYIAPLVEYKLVDEQWDSGGVISEDGWLRTTERVLNFGMTNKGCWIRFKISSKCRSFVVIESTMLDTVAWYKKDSIGFTYKGLSGIFSTDPSNTAYPCISLNDDPNSTYHDLFVFIKSDVGMYIPVIVMNERAFAQRSKIQFGLFGMIIGLFGAIFLYNLLLFLSVRDRLFLYYSLYVIGIFLTQIQLSSLGFEYIFHSQIHAKTWFIFFSTGIMSAFAGAFILEFFKDALSSNFFLKNALRLMVLLGALFPFLPLFLSRGPAFQLLNVCLIFGSLVCLVTSYVLLYQRVKKAMFIAIAWTLLLISSIIYIATTFGIIPDTTITRYAILIGASTETILLSLALGHRIKRLKEAQHKAELEVVSHANAVQELHNKVAKYKMDALRSQLNPHLLFNALNTIKHSLITNEPEKASNLIQRLSSLMRDTLEISRKDSIPLSRELKFVRDYMDLEISKGVISFDYSFEVKDNLNVEDPYIPANMIQPICENAVKHAFNKSINEQNLIRISLERHNENHIKVIVRDNGTGFIDDPELRVRRSYGISILRERLDVLLSQGHEATVEISFEPEDSEHHGTTVRMVLPIL